MSERRRKKKRHPVLIVLGLLLLVITIIGVAGFSYVNRWQQQNLAIQGTEGASVASVTSAPKSGEPITTLIVGSDKRPEWNTSRADTIIVATLAPSGEKVDILSVPRDTRVLVPGRGYEKINYSLTFGGPSLLIDSVENLLDIDINYYFEVDYMGFMGLIDAIGGVEYQVDQGWFSDEFDVEVREGAPNRSGLEALAILKSRQFARGDAQRVEHNQAFVKALSNKIIKNPSEFPNVIRAISHNAKTNISVYQLLRVGLVVSGGRPEMESESLRGSMGMLRGMSYSFVSEAALADVKAD